MTEIDYSSISISFSFSFSISISVRDLAGLIGSQLASEGADVTRVGGTCASIHFDNLYQSDDLDFVDRSSTPGTPRKAALAKLGFKPVGRYCKHSSCPSFVALPPGQLSVGDQPIRPWVTSTTALDTFALITGEDCWIDRQRCSGGVTGRPCDRRSGWHGISREYTIGARLEPGLRMKASLPNSMNLSPCSTPIDHHTP